MAVFFQVIGILPLGHNHVGRGLDSGKVQLMLLGFESTRKSHHLPSPDVSFRLKAEPYCHVSSGYLNFPFPCN